MIIYKLCCIDSFDEEYFMTKKAAEDRIFLYAEESDLSQSEADELYYIDEIEVNE